MNKILLLGATGRTGSKLLELALSGGYFVRCLVRDPSRISTTDDRLEVIAGNPVHVEQLSSAMQGMDAVIGLLNISRKIELPASPLRTPERYLSEVIEKVIDLAPAHSVQRLMICSACGTADTRPHSPGWFRVFIDNSNIGVAYRDHERQEQLIMNSDLDWTIVRPVGLTNASWPQQVITSYDNHPKPKLTISRKSVAAYMLNALENKELIGKAPTISA